MYQDFVNAVEVARILDVSRSRVAELLLEHPEEMLPPGAPPRVIRGDHFPVPQIGPGGYRLWDRRSVEAWALLDADGTKRGNRPLLPRVGGETPEVEHVLSIACGLARELNHNWVGPDHLMLAVAHPDSPGAARAVLQSLGFDLPELREIFTASFGDPFEEYDGELTIAPVVRLGLGRASLAASGLRDEVATSEHVLLILFDKWTTGYLSEWLRADGLDEQTVRERILAATEEGTPGPARAIRPDRRRSVGVLPVAPELARSPAGHDPVRRKPWRAPPFRDPDGNPIVEGGLLRQYFVDRDGYPVLTTDGQPVYTSLATTTGGFDPESGGDFVVVDAPSGSGIESFAPLLRAG